MKVGMGKNGDGSSIIRVASQHRSAPSLALAEELHNLVRAEWARSAQQLLPSTNTGGALYNGHSPPATSLYPLAIWLTTAPVAGSSYLHRPFPTVYVSHSSASVSPLPLPGPRVPSSPLQSLAAAIPGGFRAFGAQSASGVRVGLGFARDVRLSLLKTPRSSMGVPRTHSLRNLALAPTVRPLLIG